MKWKAHISRFRTGPVPLARYYLNDPAAPKPTMGAHLGVNALIIWEGKLLLERRSDNGAWGLVGGGVKKGEREEQAMAREVWEELGLRIPAQRFRRVAVYGEPGRIAAYRDGSVWRMVIVVYALELPEKPVMRLSGESRQLGFFTREALKDLPVAVTHRDIIGDWIGKNRRLFP